MDEGVKTLVGEALPEIERGLFGRPFSLDDACGLVAAYMFRRYGVSNYQCGRDVKEVLTGKLDQEGRLMRMSDGGENPGWTPAN